MFILRLWLSYFHELMMRIDGSWPFNMSLFGKIENWQPFNGLLNFILGFNWVRKSKNLAFRQDLLQTDQSLPDKGSVGQVPENLDSDLSMINSLCLGFLIFKMWEVPAPRTRPVAKECTLSSSSPLSESLRLSHP